MDSEQTQVEGGGCWLEGGGWWVVWVVGVRGSRALAGRYASRPLVPEQPARTKRKCPGDDTSRGSKLARKGELGDA